MILLSILCFILIVLAILLAAFLLIPYHYEVCGDSEANLRLQGSLSWLFGGIKISFSKYARQKKELTLQLLGIRKQLNIKAQDKKRQGKRAKPKKDPQKSKLKLSAFLQGDVLKKTFSTLGKILKHCGPRYFTVNARIGFADPMHTGLMCAFLSQFQALLSRYDLTLEPVFDEEVLVGRFSIGGKIWLPYLSVVILGFLITKPIRNIVFSRK
ncbi:MAG: DUF2953 domain-containing protein [Desulfitobacteriia bacterium]|jgi:hypothetical protein